jgi:hypothetical protein
LILARKINVQEIMHDECAWRRLLLESRLESFNKSEKKLPSKADADAASA